MIDATTSMLEKMLELRMKAVEVHTSNIANANVPEFKAKKVAFEDAMKQAVNSQNSSETQVQNERQLANAVKQIQAEVYVDANAPMKSNGNTVNMEREQTELAKNTLGYQATIEFMNRKFAMAKYVLSEGGRK